MRSKSIFSWQRIGVGVSVIAAIVSALVLTPGSAYATSRSIGNPCRSQVSGFTGGYNSSNSGVTAAQANIGNDNPTICPETFRGSSSAWSMITDSTGCYYAQTGWAKDYPYARPQSFYEITTSGCQVSTPVYVAVIANSGTHNYEVAYDGSDTFHFSIDGASVGTVQPSIHWIPGGMRYEGEVHDIADQMPGGVNAYTYFQNVVWRKSGVWYSGNLIAQNTFTYGGLWFPGGSSIGIYDTRYSS